MNKRLLSLFFVALAVLWAVEKSSAARLAIEIDATREHQRELATLEREHQRLRALQPDAAELDSLRRAVGEHARLQAELAQQEAARPAGPVTLPLGEWTPARDWKNRGQGTPSAAVETALWAAAGGDTAALKNLLSLAEPTRTKAAALLARMPDSARKFYAIPEDLIAAFTIKSIPVGEAQLVWFNESGPDDATTCVFLL